MSLLDALDDEPQERHVETDPKQGIVGRMAIALILLYQRYLSPLTPPSCRFQPTCSQYALQAIRRYGFLRGFTKFMRRFLKCHPFHPGGFDPLV
ncbi:MAG: membrane protein insertion efficiency factor YidD [Deltaproteobacteria bacterium]|nr:MAG: membrane protein insertion efficiency factor YidD [Deltaproteobacteria bacterium]